MGDQFPDITLTRPEGGTVQLSVLEKPDTYTVVSFHHPDCPCSESCGLLIAEMSEEGYEDVNVVGILASDEDDPRDLEAMDEQRKEGIVNFPIFYDPDRSVRELLGATRTPEMWVLDKDGKVAFYGAPENTLFPGSKGHRYLLREAIDALRKNEEPEFIAYQPIGCLMSD